MRLLRALLVGATLGAAPASAGGLPSECLVDPTPAAVTAGVFAGDAHCDLNGDQVVSAADVALAAAWSTLPLCPEAGATLAVVVANGAVTATAEVSVDGELVEPSCKPGALAAIYERDLSCSGSGEPCGVVDGLTPGIWVHRFLSRQGPGLQLQYRKTLVSADSVPDVLRFTQFASELTVTTPANSGNGSLRSAFQAAPGLPKPLLIRFHDLVFPAGVPTVIPLDFQLTVLSADDVTIDATDELGEVGNRIVDARGLPFGVLAVTGARNHVIGLGLRNAGGTNRDIVQISGVGAGGNVLERCEIAGSTGGDGVSVDDGAGSAEMPNRIKDCEIRQTADKGIKSTTGAYARVEGCWIHDNANGGLQATLIGNLESVENLVEDNVGETAQNGISAQGFDTLSGASTLVSRGDIVRRNGANGVAVRGYALAAIRDGYLAANGSSGLRVFNDIGDPALASAEGTAVVCNGVDGAVAADSSRLDLGGGELGSRGNNALTQNNLPDGGANLRNASTNVVNAINNQWEHCGTGTTCNDAAIAARDLSDGGLRTEFVPAQAQRALVAPVVTRVSPGKGRAGDLLRIYGSRFNAIDGHFDESACADVAGRNQCVPLRGNCVRIGGIAAPIEAVTPTMLVVRWPFTCSAPVPLVVTTDQGSIGLSSDPLTVCTNAVVAGD